MQAGIRISAISSKLPIRGALILLPLFLLCFLGISPRYALASTYGEGAYGAGNYNEGEITPTPAPQDTYSSFDEDKSGSDYNLKLSSISGIGVKDLNEETDPNTKNGGKKIKVVTTDRNRPSISFGLIDEDEKDVDIAKYDVQIQYTDILGRRQDSYKTWAKGIKHKTPGSSKTEYVGGFRVKYSGRPKDRVEVQPIIQELRDGTYYVRVKAYDLAQGSVTSKEVKLVVGEDVAKAQSGSLTLAQMGAITYEPKYRAYYYNSNLLTLLGQAPAGGQVDLYVDHVKVTQTNAGGDGSYSLHHTLPNGTYNIELQQSSNGISFTLYVDNSSSSFPDSIRSLLGL